MSDPKKPHGLTGRPGNARGRRVEHPAKPRSIRVSDPRWAEILRRAKAEGKSATEWLIDGRV